MPNFDIGFVGQITDLQRKLASIPGYTDKMAAQAATRMAMRFSAGGDKAAKAAQETARNTAKTTSEGITAVGNAMKIVSPRAGALAERLSAGARGWGVMGGAAGLAAGAVVAAGVALGAAVAGAVKLTVAADEAATRLQKLEEVSGFEIISNDQVEKVRSAKAAIDAVSTGADVMRVTFAAELAPAIERVAVDVVALELAAVDFFNTLGDGQGVVQGLATWLGTHLVKAFTGPLYAMDQMAGIAAGIARAMGEDGVAGALDDATKGYDDWAKSIAGTAVSFYAGEVTKLEHENEDYLARAREVIGAQKELNESHRQGGKAARENADGTKAARQALEAVLGIQQQVSEIREKANEDLLSETDKILQARSEELAQLAELAEKGVSLTEIERARADVVARGERDLAALRAEVAAEYEEQRESEHKRELARARQESEQLASAAAGFFASISDLASYAAEQQAEGNSRAAQRWFVWYQGAAVLQATINGALAVTKAFADLGPIAGAVAAVATAATIGLQIKKIASQELATMHSGGRVGDEVGVTALRDEHMVSRRGVKAAGGHDALDALDRGESPWPSMVEVGLRIGHRTLDRVRVELARRGGVPGAGRQPVLGHRNGV